MKPGRNDPCPCGSGLKTKKCLSFHPPSELEVRRLQLEAERAEDRRLHPEKGHAAVAAILGMSSIMELK